MSGTPTPGSLIDEFEESFQNVLAPLTKEDTLNGVNQEELQTNAEVSAQRFLELAQQMESFFLQKRYLLSIQKPELILMEDLIEMRNELSRKEELIKKHFDKLNEWQALLTNMQNRLGTSPTMAVRPSVGSSAPMHHAMMSGTHGNVPMPGMSPVGVMGPNVAIGQGNMVAGSMGMSLLGQQSMGSGIPAQHMGPSMVMSQTSMMAQMGGPMGGPSMGGMGGMPQTGYQGGGMYPSLSQQQQGSHPGGLQGPLAYLEKTTTNIGMPDPRR